MEKAQVYYYQVHVFYSTKNGFSAGIKSDKELSDDEAILQAVTEGKIDSDDARSVDWVDSIDLEDFDMLNN